MTFSVFQVGSLTNSVSNNLLLTECEGYTGEYWPEVMAVRAEHCEVCTKMTEGQYCPVRLELARLVSSLLYGTRVMLVLNLPAFKNKQYTADDCFHRNKPYGTILTKKEPIRMLGFTLPYNKCRLLTTHEVQMAGFLKIPFFACLWIKIESGSINSEKKNE